VNWENTVLILPSLVRRFEPSDVRRFEFARYIHTGELERQHRRTPHRVQHDIFTNAIGVADGRGSGGPAGEKGLAV